ncbi:MAG: heme biosynthesis HemY N-terminal domain-containing protein [Gammaproteobacteria bacterium]
MIKLFIFSLLAIALALLVSLYVGFPADPGYLLIAFGNYTFETSLFALLVAMAVLYLLLRLVIMLVQWINPMRLVRFGRGLREHQKSRSRSRTVEGLLYFTRGNWQSAFKLLRQGRSDADASVVNYLAGAYAAFKNGDKDAWNQCLDDADRKYPAARSTISSLRAQLLFHSRQLEQSLAVLKEMKNTSLNDATLLNMLKEVLIQLQDWEQLQALIPELEKHKVIGHEELDSIKQWAFAEQLAAAARVNTDRERSTTELARLWKKCDAEFRSAPKMVKHYARLLVELGAGEEAAQAIESGLGKRWDEDLVVYYGFNDLGNPSKRLLQAESWLKSRPADGILLLTLGRLSMRNQLWGKAREYFEASIKIAPSAHAHGELGRLLKHLGDSRLAEQHLQSFIEMTGDGLPGLPMPTVGPEKIKLAGKN